MKILHKKDALFELYPLMDEDDYFGINITHKIDRGNYFRNSWFEFQPELFELEITDIGGDDDWICEKDVTREQLKSELENRGFEVVLK